MTSSPDTMGPPCSNETRIFFSDNWDEKVTAKALCGGCLLRPACLRKAISQSETEGIWGGLDANERGYYRRLFGLPSGTVVDLPERYRTRPPKRTRSSAA